MDCENDGVGHRPSAPHYPITSIAVFDLIKSLKEVKIATDHTAIEVSVSTIYLRSIGPDF